MCGWDARYPSSRSDIAIPMNRPGSVSNTSTPTSAPTAAMKSGRAAMPYDLRSSDDVTRYRRMSAW